ncbi:MMPL family transporter [Amycolatopsis sp. NPDC059657]|uniref:MMPL family transporter n=1 Tax=Amycolatopsis sp. NPDC059657 TaxID=3346899 RepID=UPI003672F918
MLRKSSQPMAERVVGWSVRHRTLAIAGWLAFVALSLLASALIPGEKASGADPGESGRAKVALSTQHGSELLRENVLIQPMSDAAANDLLATLPRDAVTDVSGPLISADGRSGLVTFGLRNPDEQVKVHLKAATDAVTQVAARHPGVRLAQAGDLSLSGVVDKAVSVDLERSGLFSLPVTLLILVVVFGALVAASVPLLLAGTAVLAAVGLVGVLQHWMAVNSVTYAMILLIGLAVGVDYTLFFLRRQREERAAGRSESEALRITAKTSGHVVLVSGVTVMLCLSGLLFVGLDNLRGGAIGTALVVGVAMLGSVTVLPALLSLLGDRVNRGRVLRRVPANESRIWTSVARGVVKRPALWGGLAVALLVVMALPALGMRLQDAAVVNSLPRDFPTVDAAVRMQEAFPGSPLPARVVIWDIKGASADTPEVRAAIEGLHEQVAQSGGLLAEPLAVMKVDRAIVVRVPLAGQGTDELSNRALEALRTKALPDTIGKVGGIDFAVSGKTAVPHDMAELVTSRAPLVYLSVGLLAFILIGWAFRSLWIPLVSIVLNLLSIGAAYGALTWIFQDGHLSSVLGFTSYGAVVGWLPMFLFVLLFGLSMDYHIFILSRIRERWQSGASPHDAVVGGIGTSAGVVTSAATIMVAVFAIFVTLNAIEYKMLGTGMAIAIFVDATVVRGVLLPAAMSLLGDRAWRRSSAHAGASS